ncbi:hypothetical protein FPZ47_26370 [Mycobacterium helveticum]|uniref:Uncharacterized protein n=1 Tax=Mycobacterium helveticum TaxID=2592811 RepID=A0A557WWW2_9MYCO|nr:hypothetical protein FPZ47_26370 [Mycobacterium helveticum]TVS78302.1 hypothetical protein FPZ46_23175 [Mycobacterium helveticum]
MSLPVLVLSACSPGQNPSSRPDTVPPVKSAPPASPSATTSPAASAGSLSAQLKSPDGRSVTTTDAFTRDDLLAGDKTALMLHGAEDRDQAMQRVACGVIGAGC